MSEYTEAIEAAYGTHEHDGSDLASSSQSHVEPFFHPDDLGFGHFEPDLDGTASSFDPFTAFEAASPSDSAAREHFDNPDDEDGETTRFEEPTAQAQDAARDTDQDLDGDVDVTDESDAAEASDVEEPAAVTVVRGTVVAVTESVDQPAASTSPSAPKRTVPGASTKALEWLSSRGIPQGWTAREFDTRYITAKKDYPKILSGFAGGADGKSGALRFDYQAIAGEGWSQIRLDNPPAPVDEEGKPGKPKKYLGNSGGSTGERFMLNKTMAARLAAHEYSRVIIVEGTGQYQVASFVYADDPSTLVVGVPGCWGWSSEGLAASEVYTFCDGVKEVYVAFDADLDNFNGRRGNPKVHAAGQRLEETIIAATGARPRFLHLPSHGDKDGFDDYIAGSFRINDEHGDSIVDAARARAAVDRLLTSRKMTTFLQKNPPKEAGKEVATTEAGSPIRWVDAPGGPCIVRTRITDGRTEMVAQNFALRIVASSRVSDRLNAGAPELIYDVEVAFGEDVRTVRDVYRSGLYDIDRLAADAGFPFLAWEKSNANAAYIVATIMADAQQRGVMMGDALSHTGFFVDEDGTACWATPSGIITSGGLHPERGKALFERGTNEASIDFSCLAKATDEQIRDAWRAERDALSMYRDPAAHIVATGHQAFAVTGFPSEGGLYFVAPPNSGKTQFMRWQIQRWGKKYRAHVLPGQSEANGSDVGQGLDGVLVAMDDFKPFDGNPKAREQAVAILEMLARRAGDGVGEHSGRTGKRQVAPGQWRQGTADRAHPALMASGEEFPAELDYSSKQRILVVEYPTHNFQHHSPDGGEDIDRYAEWTAIGSSGKPNLAMASYLQYVCSTFEDNADTIEQWHDMISKGREWRTDALIKAIGLPKNLRRVGLVAASRVYGWEMWVEAGWHYGAWDEAERDRLMEFGRRLIIAAAKNHVVRYLDSVDAIEDRAEALLAAIQSLDFNQTCIQRGLEEKPGRHGWVGGFLSGSGDVAISPGLLADALNREWTRGRVTEGLRALSGQKSASWVWLFGKSARAYVIPKETWDGAASPIPDTPAELVEGASA